MLLCCVCVFLGFITYEIQTLVLRHHAIDVIVEITAHEIQVVIREH